MGVVVGHLAAGLPDRAAVERVQRPCPVIVRRSRMPTAATPRAAGLGSARLAAVPSSPERPSTAPPCPRRSVKITTMTMGKNTAKSKAWDRHTDIPATSPTPYGYATRAPASVSHEVAVTESPRHRKAGAPRQRASAQDAAYAAFKGHELVSECSDMVHSGDIAMY